MGTDLHAGTVNHCKGGERKTMNFRLYFSSQEACGSSTVMMFNRTNAPHHRSVPGTCKYFCIIGVVKSDTALLKRGNMQTDAQFQASTEQHSRNFLSNSFLYMRRLFDTFGIAKALGMCFLQSSFNEQVRAFIIPLLLVFYSLHFIFN